MARYRQDSKTGKLIQISGAKSIETGGIIVKDFDAFLSPVDGKVIRNQRELDAHNKTNNVVDSREFSAEHFEAAEKKRGKVFRGERTVRENFERKQEIDSVIRGLER